MGTLVWENTVLPKAVGFDIYCHLQGNIEFINHKIWDIQVSGS